MERVGVQLGADDAAKYFSTLDKVNKVTEILIGTTDQLADTLGFLEREEAQAGKGARGLGDSTEDAGKKLLSFDKIAEGAAHKVGALLVDGFRTAASAVLDFTVDSVKAAGDFESGMNSFEAAAGSALTEGGQSLEQFSDLFLQLGRELPVSTQEVQQAAIEMAKGGIEPATIAAGGLEQVLKFAAASGLELADAAEIASKAIGGWTDVNATAEEKAAFLAASTDLMAKAAGAASVNVDELALGLYNAQGKAKSAGVHFADTVTTLTALAPGFASSAEAGNSFKNFLSSIIPKTDSAAQAMAELGLLTEEGTSAFYDARGQFIGMEKASELLSKATKGLTQAEKSEYLQRIFGNDAMGTAVRLAELGGEGYRKLADDIAKQNGVAEQAAKKQQGWNVAVDNLMGSLEALQITAATKALPALTGLVNLLSSGVNAITAYVDATMKGETMLSTIAAVIEETAIPAIVGLTAVTGVYALTTLPALTAGLGAAAAAAALAALPFVAIGAAVAVTTLKFREYNEQVSSATDQLLETRSYWTESGAAIEDYGTRTGETAEKLKPLADNVEFLRDRLHEQLEQLGKHEAAYATFGAASGYTRESLDAELASINQLTVGLDVATQAYNNQVVAVEAEQQAVLNAQAATITATSVTNDLATATDGMGSQAALTADDIQKLTEKIKSISEEGGQALGSYASTYSTFFSDVEKRQAEHTDQIAKLEAQKAKATTEEQKKGIDDQIKQANESYAEQEAAAAESYVRQQEDQRRHLGQMLLDYTVAQATLATTDEGRRDRLLEVARAVEKEYGLQESSTASTFLAMTRSIDQFSKDSGQSIDTLITKLHDQETAAKDTQQAEDQYYKDSAAAAATSFLDKGGNVKDYVAELEKIPLDKETEVKLPDIDRREREVKDIHKQLDDLPTEVTIHINVVDNRPPDIIPESPTAFEMGLLGIADALLVAGDAAQDGLLNVLGNLDAMLPDLLGTVQNISTQMLLRIGEIDQQLRGRLPAATRTALENERKMLEEQLDLIAGAVDELPGRVNEALASAYSSTADFLRQQADNLQTIFDMGRDPGTIQKSKETQRDLTKQGEDLDKQIAEKRLRLDDIHAGRLLVTDAERKKAEEELLKLEQQRADVGDKFAAAYQEQLNAEYAREEQLKIQKRAQTALAQAQAEASAMTDPSKAAAFLKLRTDQITRLAELEQRRASATTQGERELIDTQISLEKQAQAADLKAFELQQDQLGATQDLIAALGTLNDNLTITGDLPPVILALMQLIAQLEGRASGGAMAAMHPYIVGERGPEIVVPDRASTILNALDSRRALAPPTMLGGTTNNYGGAATIYIDARDFGVGADAIGRAVEAVVNGAGYRSDVRIRMGVG